MKRTFLIALLSVFLVLTLIFFLYLKSRDNASEHYLNNQFTVNHSADDPIVVTPPPACDPITTPTPTPMPTPAPTPTPMPEPEELPLPAEETITEIDQTALFFDGASDEIILEKSVISEYNDEFLYGTYYELEYNLEKVFYYVPYEINDETSVVIYVPGSTNLPKYPPEVEYIKAHEINSIVIFRLSGRLVSVYKCADNFIKMVNDIRYTYGVKRTDIDVMGFSQGGEFALILIESLSKLFPEAAPSKLILLDATLVSNGGLGRFLKAEETEALQQNKTVVFAFESNLYSITRFHDYFPQNDIESYLVIREGTHRGIGQNAVEHGLIQWLEGYQAELDVDEEPYAYYRYDTDLNDWVETDGTQIIKP